MAQEASLEFRLRKIDETRNYLFTEIKHNDSMSEKYKMTCKFMNYVERFLILVSVSAFASLVALPVGITNSAVEIKIYAIPTGINNYKSIIKKKKKTHDEIVLLRKDKLNTIEILISKDLIDSYISHNEFVSVNNV